VETAGWGALAGFGLLFLLETAAMGDSCGEYLEECTSHYLGWAALAALCLHSFIDGFNLSVSYLAGGLAGGAVGLALALHKVADGFTLATLFREGGFTKRGSGLAVLGVALATPAGALVHQLTMSSMHPPLAGALLGFAAGSFLYIGAADILPRIHKQGDKLSPALFTAGLLGIGVLKHFVGGH
jgi:zinc transporter ZupT